MEDYSVYVHIAPNGKMYVGITKQRPIRRWHGGHGYRNQPKFYNAIKKYGWNNFYHGVLVENISEDSACALEQYLIKRYNTISNGYNQTTGGTIGYTHSCSEDTKQLISLRHKGRTLSPEHKAKACEQLAKNREERQRGVYCVETGECFQSIKEAAYTYDLDPCHINECCKGRRKTHGKLHWKYWEVDDGEKTLGESWTN